MELRSTHAADHRQDAASWPAGLIRREIDRGLRDLLRLSQPTHRMYPFDRGLELWILQHTCNARGDDPGWADAVAPDVLLRVVHRHRLGEHDDARLGRLVGMGLKAGDGLEPADRGDIQDRAASLPQHLGNCRANESKRALQEHVECLIAKTFAIASPMPVPPPVTIATLSSSLTDVPSSRSDSFDSSIALGHHAFCSAERMIPSTMHLFKHPVATNLAPSSYILASNPFPSASMNVTEDKSTCTG